MFSFATRSESNQNLHIVKKIVKSSIFMRKLCFISCRFATVVCDNHFWWGILISSRLGTSPKSNKKNRVSAIYCRIKNSLVKRDFSYLISFANNKVLYESCCHLFFAQWVEILSRGAFFFNFFKAEFSKEAQFLVSSFLHALAALLTPA